MNSHAHSTALLDEAIDDLRAALSSVERAQRARDPQAARTGLLFARVSAENAVLSINLARDEK